jgi:LAGLIDADG endonuclease
MSPLSVLTECEHVFVVEFDNPFLAGFVAGEGHFSISENNSGQSWACGFALAQRDDNAELVAGARDLAGCGRVRWCPPRATSEAQVHWVVDSMRDCRTLAASLGACPLLGKKAGDFAIWQQAVSIWSDRSQGALRWEHLKRLARDLRAHRDPAVEVDYTRVDISTAALSSFLAGFASAEGHFGAPSTGPPRFVLKLRADDTAVLTMLADRFAVGRLVSLPPSRHGSSQTAWLVTRLDELRVLVTVFDRHPPLGRAGRVYIHWRQLVLAANRSVTALHPIVDRLREARRYRAATQLPLSPPRQESTRDRYVAVLQAWARQADPPYTATSYEEWRHRVEPGRPNRNTLAKLFGSWRDALAAAALPQDGLRAARTNARAVETAAAARGASRLRRRAAVLRAVDECWTALGRVPGASEFFRWRLASAPQSPSQAVVYRLFPGGWAAVLDALPPRGTAPSAVSGPVDEPVQPPAQPLHVPTPPREDLARVPDVQPGSLDQVGHEGVAGDQVAAWQRE